jgi:hypothetical protein
MGQDERDLVALIREARALLGRSVSGDDIGRLAMLYDDVRALRDRADSLLAEVAELHAEAMRSHRLRG